MSRSACTTPPDIICAEKAFSHQDKRPQYQFRNKQFMAISSDISNEIK